MQNKANFPDTQTNISSVKTKECVNKRLCSRRENKPKQTEAEKKSSGVRMHRVILKPPEGKFFDHINHNGLDNRRANLRIVTRQQNSWNKRKQRGNCSSQYKGVTWLKSEGKWQARINRNGRHISVGYFDDEKAAARAYDAKARELFGDYASLNLEFRK